MSHLLLRSFTALVCLSLFSLPQTSAAPKADQSDAPNLSGIWTLDLNASASLEPLMNQIGASLPERKYVTSTELKATLHQTENVLTVATRGSGFALDETLTWTDAPIQATCNSWERLLSRLKPPGPTITSSSSRHIRSKQNREKRDNWSSPGT